VADLVVLSADPTSDIRHTRDIVYMFSEGRRYEAPKAVSGKR
jgi:imidazolonepropionase-like amidohydrolase